VPSVSIVLPTRNRPAELVQALDSVARQTHPELELVLVRDGGVPLGPEAIERLGRLEFPAHGVEHEDPPEGLAASRNRGIQASRADAVAFLDDDDLWEPDHVARLAAALDREPGLDVVYTDTWVLNEPTGDRRTLAHDFDLEVFSRDSFIPPSSVMVRRRAFDRFGLFDSEMPYSEDWDWLLRVALGRGRIERVPGASVTIRIHSGGMSQLHDPERIAERRRCLDLISSRYGLAPIEPKTFWEVAGSLCPGSVCPEPKSSTR
jgi:glycosyltransferase involved in cell wall biosynthesis